MEMNEFIESSAGRIAARIHSIGGSFDPEVLSLPGGSIIAVCLWLYASSRLTMKRGDPSVRPVIEPVAPVVCAGCTGHP
jgi:hypothetical protein